MIYIIQIEILIMNILMKINKTFNNKVLFLLAEFKLIDLIKYNKELLNNVKY